MYPVYLITCFHPDYGQKLMPYVGCIVTTGKTIEKRFKEHCQGQRTYINRAIRKHGQDWFQIEQIDAGNTPEQALELERWWIKRLGTKAPAGYNLTDGGEGVLGFDASGLLGNKHALGYRHTHEARARISEARKGQPKSAETRQKIRVSRKRLGLPGPSFEGRKHTAESRAKMSASAKARWGSK